MPKAPIFEKTYEEYLQQIGQLDLKDRQAALGYDMDGPRAIIPMFDQRFYVSHENICDSQGHRPDLAVAVVLCKYLLLSPSAPLNSRALKTFKDFKDSAPLISYFENNVQGRIARIFNGRATVLGHACELLGGKPYAQDLAYDVKYQFSGLPRIPVYLLFNDEEEGFAAQCTLLFEHQAENYLDMESLAILAGRLSMRLTEADKRQRFGGAQD